MSRAQALITRGLRILLARHRDEKDIWWCLPGGGIEKNEKPEQCVLREVKEECSVTGKIKRLASHIIHDDGQNYYTYIVSIGDQEPKLGFDPEKNKNHKLVAIEQLELEQIPERDRAFLWQSGLIGIPDFYKIIESWGKKISLP